MNDFKESIKIERDKSGKIAITEELKDILIQVMNGEMTKKQAMEITGIGDKGTIELKIQELVKLNPESIQLYQNYISKKNNNFNGYSFRAEAIDMLRKDYSQSEMATRLKGIISRRAFSTKIKNIEERENPDSILRKLLIEHAERKMKRQEINKEELIKINLLLDEYVEEHSIGMPRYEKRNPLEVRLENYKRVLESIDLLMQDGMTLKQICDKGIITEGTYRKYRTEVESLTEILKNYSNQQTIDKKISQQTGGEDR